MKKINLIFMVLSLLAVQTLFADVLDMEKKDKSLILKINDLPRNSVSIAVLKKINIALDKALNDDTIFSVIITGSKDVFSSGAGGESLKKSNKTEKTQAKLAYKTFRRIEAFPKIVIASINGVSAGGGNELALSCDIRFASKNAKFRQHELQAGLIPGFGATQRLPRLIGRSRAMEMMLTGDFLSSSEALKYGLISKVFDDDRLLSESLKFANTLEQKIDKKALALFKKRMSKSLNESYDLALQNDEKSFEKIAQDPQTLKAIKKFIKRQKK